MKLVIVSLFILPLSLCATIPEISFQHCLVSYLNSQGIESDLNDVKHFKDEGNCDALHKSITEMIDAAYTDVESNLKSVLENQTEVNCLINSIRLNKLLEISVILNNAYQMSPEIKKNVVKEVAARTKLIFTIATVECLINGHMILGIIKDFSPKLNVDEQELKCIRKSFELVNELVDPETTTNFADVEYISNSTSIENGNNFDSGEEDESTTLPDDLTTTDFSNDGPNRENMIAKQSSQEYSVETDAALIDSCNATLDNLKNRFTTFNISSLTEDQNRCMSNRFKDYDIISLFKSFSNGRIQLTEDIFKNIIFSYIQAMIECTDLFDFSANIENLEEILNLKD